MRLPINRHFDCMTRCQNYEGGTAGSGCQSVCDLLINHPAAPQAGQEPDAAPSPEGHAAGPASAAGEKEKPWQA